MEFGADNDVIVNQRNPIIFLVLYSLFLQVTWWILSQWRGRTYHKTTNNLVNLNSCFYKD